MKGPLALLLIILSLGCAHRGSKTTLRGTELVLSLQEFSDDQIVSLLEKRVGGRKGVHYLQFDRKTAELTLRYDSSRFTAEQLLQFVKDTGVEAEMGAGVGTFAPDLRYPQDRDVTWASRKGERIGLEMHLSPKRVTVFTFYARWCADCRKLDEDLLEWLKKDEFLAVRRVLVEDWDSPVMLQFAVTKLPYVIVFDDEGKRAGEVQGYDRRAIGSLLRAGQIP